MGQLDGGPVVTAGGIELRLHRWHWPTSARRHGPRRERSASCEAALCRARRPVGRPGAGYRANLAAEKPGHASWPPAFIARLSIATPSIESTCISTGAFVASSPIQSSYERLPPEFKIRQMSPLAPTWIEGNTCPLTVWYQPPPVKSPASTTTPGQNPVGRPLGGSPQKVGSSWVLMIPFARTCVSFSVRWRTLPARTWATQLALAHMSSGVPMVMMPDMPDVTWFRAMPCRCGWNQKWPDGWLAGIWIA